MMIKVWKRPGGNPVGRFFTSLVPGGMGSGRSQMTDGHGDAGPTDEDVLALAEAMYREAAVELHRAIDAIRSGALGELKAAQTAIRDLRAAASQVLDERGRIDKLRKQGAGQAGPGGSIDFNAARTEIGRRLACLRDRGGCE